MNKKTTEILKGKNIVIGKIRGKVQPRSLARICIKVNALSIYGNRKQFRYIVLAWDLISVHEKNT